MTVVIHLSLTDFSCCIETRCNFVS